ncbi:hypothetical protein C0993_001924, partial [Termitomyces sp. T159_Od127]
VHNLAAEIAKTWNAMTPEEQKIVMDRLLKDLQEQRDLSTYGRHNVQLESVADVIQPLLSLE